MQFQRAPFLIKDEGLFYKAEIFVGKGIASLASYKIDRKTLNWLDKLGWF